MRVLMIGPRGHGGEEVYVRSLAEHPPEGVEYVHAGGFHSGAPGAPCRVLEEIFLNRVVHPRLVPDLGFRSLRLRDRFELVHVHAHPIRLGGLRDIPLVMSEGSSSAVYLGDYLGWEDERLERGYSRARRAYRWLGIHDRLLRLDRVARVYVFSHWARELNVRWGANPAKIEVVYPGFPTPPEIARPDRDGFVFLFVGTDFERKGGFDVVEAFASIAPEHPEAKLVLVSSDPWQTNPDRLLHSWISRPARERILGILKTLEANGTARRFPLADRATLYSRFYPEADAFVMPSRAEGFGFTNVEAHSFGLPVVSSRLGAIREVVDDGVSGLLVEPGDVEGIASAMRSLLEDRRAAHRMGHAGRASFLEKFTLDHFRNALGSLYRRAIEGR